MKKNQLDWVKLVEDAKRDNEGLKRLYEALDYMFNYLKVRCPVLYQEDAIQEARILIWEVLDKIDLSRPTDIRAYLCLTMFRIMCRTVTKYNRQLGFNSAEICCKSLDFSEPTRGESDLYDTIPIETQREYLFDYEEILQLYLKYIEEYGKVCGVGKYLAKKFGVSGTTITDWIRKEKRRFIKKYHLAGALN